MLVEVQDSTSVEDHRTDHVTPGVAEESLVLSCQGTATWDDGTESPVLTDLYIDAAELLFVDFVGL